MDWTLVGALVWAVAASALALFFHAQFRQSVRQGFALSSYALLLLLDDNERAGHRKGLFDVVKGIEAESPQVLAVNVSNSIARLAMSSTGFITQTMAVLWKIKTGQTLR